MTERIQVLIVDDHTVVRHGLRLMLELKPGIAVVGEARDGGEAIDLAARLQPDVILMDLEMPRISGAQAIAEIRRQRPNARILVLTSFSDSDKITEAIRAGAAGYLLKDSSPAELVQVIQDVFAGRVSLPPEIAQKLFLELQQPALPAPVEVSLTGREKEILCLAAGGLSNAEIAARLVLSEGTVRFHLSNVFSKLQVRNRSQAILFALRQGWVDLKPG